MTNNITIITKTRKVFLNKKILGISGENEIETLQFNLDNFINGEALLRIKKYDKNGQLQKYEIVIDKGEECYLLDVKSSLLDVVGTIKMQLVIMQEELEVFKTKVFEMEVLEAIEIGEEIPEQYPTWEQILAQKVIQIDNKIDEVTELEEDLEGKVQSGYFKGDKGDDGESAYQIWLDEGNVGTEQDFLDSLKGEKGQDGENGDCNFATFDIEDGDLIMNKDDDMNIDFVINQGNLVVII